jgi:hypothetical protein
VELAGVRLDAAGAVAVSDRAARSLREQLGRRLVCHPGLARALGSRVTPLVVGPDLIPVVTDVDEASQAPELVVLSAVVHGGKPANTDVLGVLLKALSFVENQQAFLYLELVLAALPGAARRGVTWRN